MDSCNDNCRSADLSQSLYEAKKPKLITAYVRRSWILALKLDGEEEIIAFEVQVEKVEPAIQWDRRPVSANDEFHAQSDE